MSTRSRSHSRTTVAVLAAMALLMTLATPATAEPPDTGFLTAESPFITIDPALPAGASVTPIISVGDRVGDFLFEGLPDGIGIRPGPDKNTVDVYVAHEQTTIPFFGTRDFQDASVSRLTLTTNGPNRGSVVSADVAIGPEEGFVRFCSASIAGPDDGLDDYVFFTGEEANDGDGPTQHGFAVVLNTRTGEHTAVPGMGRLNHENTVVVPGGWDDGVVMLTTDDTFSGPSAQLYMYVAADQDAIFDDEGSLYALRISGVDGTPLADPSDAFNGANDYLDLDVGEDFQGEFIPVPDSVADGDQSDLEDWSNDNNVFQMIRLEDVATDKTDPRVVYFADTGRTRVVPDPTTGRMTRGPGGTVGSADNGRIFKMVMNEDDPLVVDSLSIMADGDLVGTDVYVPMINPDNIDTSKNSLMVQEDRDGAVIWQHRFNQDSWRVVASVNDGEGESSGIVDASDWFGQGSWLLDVQGHGTFIDTDSTSIPGTLIKRESGQLLLLKVPAS